MKARRTEPRAVSEPSRRLRELEACWCTLLEEAPDAVFIILDGRVRFANRAAARMFAASAPDELIGRRILELVHPQDRSKARRRISRVLRTGRTPKHMDLRYRRLDGTVFIGSGRPVRIAQEETAAILAVVRDVTPERRAYAELRRSEQRLQDFAELACDWFWETDAEHRYVWFSRKMEEVTGVPPEWHYGKTRFEILGDDMDPKELEEHRRILERRLPYREFDLQRRGPEGRIHWIRSNGKPVFDDSGNFLGYRGTGRDITEMKRAELELRRREELYRRLVSLLPDAVLVHREERIEFANEATAALLGAATVEEICGRSVLEFIPIEDRERISKRIDEIRRTGKGVPRRIRVRRLDGEIRLVETRAIRIEEGEKPAVLVVAVDVTDLERHRAERHRMERRYRKLVELSPDGIVLQRNGVILFANARAAAILGLARAEELVGRSALDLVHPRDRGILEERWARLAAGADIQTGEVRVQLPDGSARIVECRATLFEEDGEATVLTVFRDVTRRRRMEEEMCRLALRDPLTGLANRAVFRDSLANAVEFARRYDSLGAVILVDLDNFKGVNDTLGHSVGDGLLSVLAGRMRETVRDSDIVARLGGDEFAILLHGLRSEEEARLAALRLQQAVERRVEVEGHEIRPRASIGIALFPTHAATAEEILRAADLALYEAKRHGGDQRSAVFTPALAKRMEERERIERELRAHIAEERIEVEYQPVLDLVTNRIVGVEALARWPAMDEDGSRVSPDLFVEIAEQRGLVARMDALVLKKALHEIGGLGRELGHPLRLAVNISPQELADESYRDRLLTLVRSTCFPIHQLELEITERVLLEHSDAVRRSLARLREIGVSFAIDDFGTGYSSLVYLKQFPVRCLKLDRCFVQGLPDDPEDRAIVDAVMGLARSMEIEVLAEGVESPEQRDFLRNAGCSEGQGYLWYPPVPFGKLRGIVLDEGCKGMEGTARTAIRDAVPALPCPD